LSYEYWEAILFFWLDTKYDYIHWHSGHIESFGSKTIPNGIIVSWNGLKHEQQDTKMALFASHGYEIPMKRLLQNIWQFSQSIA
jgi:hypothetical protein